MKNKALIIILIGIIILNISLIISNQRLNNEYKAITFSKGDDAITEVDFNDNNNLKYINDAVNAINKIKIQEVKSVEILGNNLIVNIKAPTIESLKSMEKSISKELKLGVPEMELYFNEKGITGFLKYKGEIL